MNTFSIPGIRALGKRVKCNAKTVCDIKSSQTCKPDHIDKKYQKVI